MNEAEYEITSMKMSDGYSDEFTTYGICIFLNNNNQRNIIYHCADVST